MFIFLQNSFNVSEWNLCLNLKQFLRESIFNKYQFAPLYYVICWKTAHFLYNQELAVVVYSTQKGFVINNEYVSSDRWLWSAWYFVMYCSFLCGCICWYSRHMVHCFAIYSMSVFMLIQCTDSLTRGHVFSMPIWLLCTCSSICFCNI